MVLYPFYIITLAKIRKPQRATCLNIHFVTANVIIEIEMVLIILMSLLRLETERKKAQKEMNFCRLCTFFRLLAKKKKKMITFITFTWLF